MARAPVWFLYIVRAADNSLYTGITTNVSRRLSEHADGGVGKTKRGAKALRGKAPLTLEYSYEIGNRSEAQKIECQVKKLSKVNKEKLVAGSAELESLLTIGVVE